jgi:hypothetical protein
MPRQVLTSSVEKGLRARPSHSTYGHPYLWRPLNECLRSFSTGADPPNGQSAAGQSPPELPAEGGRRTQSLPLQHFQALLTLCSKFFSPFARATCLLSVFGRYLALREVYLPLWAALSGNPTRRRHRIWNISPRPPNGAVTLNGTLFQGTCVSAAPYDTALGHTSKR